MSRWLPEELEALHSHTFRVKTFKKTKHCSACKQTIVQDGLVCRVCRIACHKKCEAKVRVRTILTSSRFSVPKGSKCLV
ncbi:tensin-2-like isoform X4 [Fundulus heteroclitus]|uniref:tensin-2-like isoform X4 n=1 Tax=Fundulus heteroclitus TaxID=8078 RepID=UPI00165C7DF1|nr:tensin-2-like isoform X4 [Fundulus heteroclitus]